jgi:hypothetical protein
LLPLDLLGLSLSCLSLAELTGRTSSLLVWQVCSAWSRVKVPWTKLALLGGGPQPGSTLTVSLPDLARLAALRSLTFTNYLSFAPGFDLEAAWNLEEICCVYKRQLAETFLKAKLGPKVVFIWTVSEPISVDDHPPGRFGGLYFMQCQHSDLQQVTRLFNDEAHPGARYLSLCGQVKGYELKNMPFLRHLRMFSCAVPARVSLAALRVLELHGTHSHSLLVRTCRAWPALQELHVSDDDSFSADTVLVLECPHLVELSVRRCVLFWPQACSKILNAHRILWQTQKSWT